MGRPDNVIAALYANRLPDSIIFRGGDGSLLSTAAARAKVERFAASLLRLGVRPGDRISMRVEKSLNAILLAHACLWIGAILHPLNNAYTPHELAALLADAEPALLITSPDEFVALRPVGEQARARVIALDGETSTWLADPSTSAKPHAPSRPDEGAVLLYTSGTTGKPKGALITHENLLSSARALSTIWGVTGDDILLHALPIFHAHGLLTSINTMIAGGGSVLLLPSFNVDAVLAALRGCTMMMGVPTHYARLVQHPAFPEAIGPDFRLAISGSAPLPESLANDFTRLSRVPLLERYGSTEAAIITGIPFTVADRTGWVGWPLPDVSIRVAASGGHRSTVGIGVVETRGSNVFAGYWRNDRATAEAFTSDGWFITGDIGEIDGSGCLRLLGREKDLIISGGLNVYPAEVENEMHRLGGVKEAAAFGVPHPDFGEAVVGAVQLVAGAEFDERSAIAALRDRLAAYKTPKRIVVVDELPRNAIGKIVKTSLRESFSGLFTAQQQIKGKH